VSSNYRTYVAKYFVYYIGRLLGSGETVYIHGLPYVFERRLGGGAFGKLHLMISRKWFLCFEN